VGAIAAAVSRQLPAARPTAWMIGVLLGGSRVLLLAHWASDVLAGLALGAGLEHIINQVWDRAPRGATSGEHAQVSSEKGAGRHACPAVLTSGDDDEEKLVSSCARVSDYRGRPGFDPHDQRS